MGVDAVVLKGTDFTDTVVSDGNTNTDVNASNSTVPTDVVETSNKKGNKFITPNADAITFKTAEGLQTGDGSNFASEGTYNRDIATTESGLYMQAVRLAGVNGKNRLHIPLKVDDAGVIDIAIKLRIISWADNRSIVYAEMWYDTLNRLQMFFTFDNGSKTLTSRNRVASSNSEQVDAWTDEYLWIRLRMDTANASTYYDLDETHTRDNFVWTQHLANDTQFAQDVYLSLRVECDQINGVEAKVEIEEIIYLEGTPTAGQTSHRTTSSAKSTAQALGTDVGSEGRIRLAYEDAQNTVQIKVYNADTDALLATADAVSSGTQEELDDHTTLRSDADLEAYFKYEDDATDEKGNHNGTPANITYTGGPFNQAAVFNGSNATIDISGGMLRGLQQFSIASMVYVDNTGSGTRYIYLEFKGAGTRGRLQFYVSSTNKIVVDCEPNDANTSGRTNLISNSVLSDNTWYHVVVTMDLSTRIVKIYINGLLDAAEDDGSGSYTITDTASLNADIGSNKGAAAFFKGRLDETYLFKRLLTAAEIYLLYSNKATLVFDDVSAITGNIDVQSNFVSEEIPGPGHGVGLLEFALDTTPGIVAGKRGSIII